MHWWWSKDDAEYERLRDELKDRLLSWEEMGREQARQHFAVSRAFDEELSRLEDEAEEKEREEEEREDGVD